MPLLQDTGSQLFYCLLSTLSISIESILYLLNLPCLTSASLVRRESGATAKLSPVMDVESGATYVVVSPSPWRNTSVCPRVILHLTGSALVVCLLQTRVFVLRSQHSLLWNLPGYQVYILSLLVFILILNMKISIIYDYKLSLLYNIFISEEPMDVTEPFRYVAV